MFHMPKIWLIETQSAVAEENVITQRESANAILAMGATIVERCDVSAIAAIMENA